jgi:hypothetical protein
VPSLLIGLLATAAGIGMSLYGISTGLNASQGDSTGVFMTMGAILLISVFLVLYFVVFAKYTQRWLQQKWAIPLVFRLTHNHQSRKTALVIAALIFTLGFLLQFVAVLLG